MKPVALHRHYERFAAKTREESSGCYAWTASVTPNGYGQFGIGRRLFYAHRIAYEMFVGPIPGGLQIDHLCRNRACVNPEHLEAVTQRENILRGTAISAQCAVKTVCLRGHPFTEENTYKRPDGSRECRACSRARRQQAAVAA